MWSPPTENFLNKGLIKTIVRHQSSPTQMAKIENTDNMQYPQGCEGIRMSMP